MKSEDAKEVLKVEQGSNLTTQESDHNPADLPEKFVRNKSDQEEIKEEEVK